MMGWGIGLLFSTDSWAAKVSCQDVFTPTSLRQNPSLDPELLAGAKYLSKKNPQLHLSSPVLLASQRAQEQNPQVRLSKAPEAKIAYWMQQMENKHSSMEESNPKFQRILQSYFQKYVIKEEDIPKEYFELQQRLAREQGHGNIQITEDFKKEKSQNVIRDQKSSLEEWIKYFSSEQSSQYPMWAKYWAFEGMLKLGVYTAEDVRFGKRTKSTVAPFPEVYREALAKVIEWMQWKVLQNLKENTRKLENSPQEIVEDENLRQLVQLGSFDELYTYAIKKYGQQNPSLWTQTEGQWIKYAQGSDAKKLVNSLQGYGTGWCTAAFSTAEQQLKNGDFYIYYSVDPQGQYQIPRAAIRMENGKIAEVRGVAKQQNLDPFIASVVEKKMTEFPDGKEYQKKASDMKRLTSIEIKNKKQEPLNKEELRFLYELDGKIQGFGYESDPRIEEIKSSRNLKADFAVIHDCRPEDISTTKEEALSGRFKVHVGSLYLNTIKDSQNLKLPEFIYGNINLGGLTSAKGLILPKILHGGLHLDGLTSAEGLILPKELHGSLDLGRLTSAEGLILPRVFHGRLDLGRLTSAKGVILPRVLHGYLHLGGLTSAEGLILPKVFHGNLYLHGLTSAEGLILPKEFHGDLYLNSLPTTEGWILPEKFSGSIYLNTKVAANFQPPSGVHVEIED